VVAKSGGSWYEINFECCPLFERGRSSREVERLLLLRKKERPETEKDSLSKKKVLNALNADCNKSIFEVCTRARINFFV